MQRPSDKGASHNIINLRNREVEKGCYVQALSFFPSLTSRFKILRFPSPCGISHFVKFMMLCLAPFGGPSCSVPEPVGSDMERELHAQKRRPPVAGEPPLFHHPHAALRQAQAPVAPVSAAAFASFAGACRCRTTTPRLSGAYLSLRALYIAKSPRRNRGIPTPKATKRNHIT
jgi:hypothetical protein